MQKMLEELKMKIVDKLIEYFFGRKIKVRNFANIEKVDSEYYNATIYAKLPFVKKYCVWSSYTKDEDYVRNVLESAYNNKHIVKDEITLSAYIDTIWENIKNSWLNVIDIIEDDGDVIKKSNGVFKKPIRKWHWGFGIHNRVFKPYHDDYINPILYINKWSLSWKPKYNYVCFEDNAQVWFCFFKFFWFGYELVSPIDEDFEDSYWEQMIWYVNYCDCDLKKAEDTYYGNWNKEYLING